MTEVERRFWAGLVVWGVVVLSSFFQFFAPFLLLLLLLFQANDRMSECMAGDIM